MSLMIWWLDKGAKLAPSAVDTIFRCLSLEGIAPPNGQTKWGWGRRLRGLRLAYF